jgi:hypothetical protein
MPTGAAAKLVNRLEALLAGAVVIAFFLPWVENATASLSGLELVSLARGRQSEQAEAMLLVAFSAIPVLALLTLGAALLGHGARLFGGLCGGFAVAGTGLLWLARQDADPASGAMLPAYGTYATLLLGLLLVLAAFGVVRLPERRLGPGTARGAERR